MLLLQQRESNCKFIDNLRSLYKFDRDSQGIGCYFLEGRYCSLPTNSPWVNNSKVHVTWNMSFLHVFQFNRCVLQHKKHCYVF